ncbi:unnamed protein product [Rotaria sp. Silwood1]|nr:unnamed protein product [Rotaria sp. Silwood1]CAF1655009.1 unnamed protein product [Rotaria sp. Silwood1]CAF3859441.1 unnamed protein product [Rotaria sp. Silwood1]CAF5017095.1 unnamed protein product [Rotaria sp. Silwood1]
MVEGNKSWKKNIKHLFSNLHSALIQKLQKFDFDADSSINNSSSPGSAATSKKSEAILAPLNVPLAVSSQSPNFEGITLIWFDPRLNTTDDTKQTAKELREINNYVIFHSDQLECVDYIKSVRDEKIFLITSGKAASSILPETIQLKQIDSIFIFCFKIEKYQDLLQKYESVVGIYSNRSTLINAIKENVDLLQKQLNAFSFYNEHQEKATRDLSQESAEFIWFQLFKDVILRMSANNNAKEQLIQFCSQYYRGNQKEYKNIDQFESSYRPDKCIYWYTRETFLYKLVNKALRTEDMAQLYIFRFFIVDLSLHLAKLHEKNREKDKVVMLYRGLKLENEELNRLKQNEGNLISTNGFLSTSRSKQVALKFALKSAKRTNVVSTLYEIECNLNESKSIVFADITKYSEFAAEQEVLFDLGSTFKIQSIIEDKELKLFVVKLKASDDGEKMAKEYIESNRKVNEETSLDILFGKLLLQMGKYDQSINYFENLLNESNEKADIARIYNEVGCAYLCKGEFKEAHEYICRAYIMMIQAKPCRVKDSARPLTNMANIYLRKEMYNESLDFYFQALEIRENFYGKEHLDTAITLNNIGNAYYKMQDYLTSLMYYEKSFDIRRKQLPKTDMDIAASLNNIGLVYSKMNRVYEALDCYLQSLEIRKRILPSEHNDIVQSLMNIAHVLYEQNAIDDALNYFSKALQIQKIEFDLTDRDKLVDRLEKHFGPKLSHDASQNIVYAESCRYIPSDSSSQVSHWPEYAICIRNAEPVNNITYREYHEALNICPAPPRRRIQEFVYSLFDEFIKALHENNDDQKILNLWKQVLNNCNETFDDHSGNIQNLIWRLENDIIHTYNSFDESKEALHFYEKALSILESSTSPLVDIDNIRIVCLDRIATIHQRNDNFESALGYLIRGLNVMQRKEIIPRAIADKMRHIGLVHMTLGNYDLALTSFNNALTILQSDSIDPNDREIKLTLRRIDEAKEALESTTNA